MYTDKLKQIENTIQNYFEGIFHGDVSKLKSSFTTEALLYGDVGGTPYHKGLDDYLEGVKNRKSPKALGETFAMQVLDIEVLGKVATAKLHVPMLGFNYYDYLSLVMINDEWKIVNKLFTHVEQN
ncbi:nuclear transport factor 2 family protein [uncultured Microscilla sp.]|uniref:nuclear transport factor 2 family protein n=1 Tax=uncultured Microscilla sp. TaxID=432653 RepID=UPI00262FBFCE|nr:nuclear transport factor 2 family protein [uncultured Microscilla sp.]